MVWLAESFKHVHFNYFHPVYYIIMSHKSYKYDTFKNLLVKLLAYLYLKNASGSKSLKDYFKKLPLETVF